MTKPTDSEIITRAVALLNEGLLPSLLPARLLLEYRLSRDRAGRLAGEAQKQVREGQR